jgi:uncharacterized protein (TIGR03437 family)
LAFLTASCAIAQPVISSTEVVNSASYLNQGLPGSGIAQGSIFTIFGSGLGPNTLLQAGPLPLQTSLGGTSVAVTVNGQTVKAFILAAVGSQVNALLPSTTPTGNGTAIVTYTNQPSVPAPVEIVSASFAPFTFNSRGSGQAIATDLNYQVNSIIHTFHPGDWVVLWGTGLGPINGDDSNQPPVGNVGSPTVHVGNASLTPYYAGRSVDYPGLDQVTFQVPSGIQGCSVPVAVEANGLVGGSATIAVSTSGQTCSDSVLGQDLVGKLAAGGTVDFGFAQVFATLLNAGGLSFGNTPDQASAAFTPDDVSATFSEFTPPTAGLASYGVSQGYCITNTRNPDASPAQLDAGAGVTMQSLQILTQGLAPVTAPRLYGGDYFGAFYSQGDNFFSTYFDYAVSGPGGAKVGPFSVTDATWFPMVQFSSIAVGQTLSRSGDLTVTWTGGFPTLQEAQVTIGGVSWPTPAQNIAGYFLCTAPLSTQSFTIPKWVLSTLPPSGTGEVTLNGVASASYPLGYVWIGQPNNPVTFQATGLDKGILMELFFNGYPVNFQ